MKIQRFIVYVDYGYEADFADQLDKISCTEQEIKNIPEDILLSLHERVYHMVSENSFGISSIEQYDTEDTEDTEDTDGEET